MSYILDALKKSESERGHGAIPGVQTVHSSSINYHQQKKALWPYFLIAAILLNIVVIAYFIYTQNSPAPSTLVPVVQNHSTLTGSTRPLSTLAPSAPALSNSVPATIEKTPVSLTPVSLASVNMAPAKLTPPPSIFPIAEVTPTPPIANRQTLEEDNLKEEGLNASAFTYEKAVDEPAISPQLIDAPGEPTDEQIIEQHELPEHIQRQLPALIISAHVYSSSPSQRSLIVNNEFFEEQDYIMDDIILHEITRDGAIFSYNGLLFHNRSVSGWQ